MKVKKFIFAPNSSTIILNPEWIKINYPLTFELIVQEVRYQIEQQNCDDLAETHMLEQEALEDNNE